MKAIRRSLKGDKEKDPHNHNNNSHHYSSSFSSSKPHRISVSPKSAIAILPPKKVIKALYDHQPASGSPYELPFAKGDFFHVINRENDPYWYEACNPLIPSCRGLVPVSFFEPIGKNERESGGSVDLRSLPNYHSNTNNTLTHTHSHTHSRTHNNKASHDSGYSDSSTNTSKQAAQTRMSSLGKASGAMVYGIVQYDFQAERSDELDAKSGEAIIVIAQSNPEWFVAKPIGRLGGPGLIPVSFVELKDIQTGMAVADPLEAVRRAGVPRVEEWKKMTAEYKNSSITLGKIDSVPPPHPTSVGGGIGHHSTSSGADIMSPNSRQSAGQSAGAGNNGNVGHQRNVSRGTMPQMVPRKNSHLLPIPVEAYIPRYCFDNDRYWYLVEAKMEDGRCWELARYYHDFYDFQIALLTQFPEEAGKTGKPRILPYMPGPVTHVTDSIANGRRVSLDDFLKRILSLPPRVSRCHLVRELFAIRPGDFEIDTDVFGEDTRFSAGSHLSSSSASRKSSSQLHQNSLPLVNGQSYSHQYYQPQPQPQRLRPQQLNSGGGAAFSRPDLQAQMMNRQPSLTPVSTPSSASAMKVKVFFQDDLIAIRMPTDINFHQLLDKLTERLRIKGGFFVQYRDEHSGAFFNLTSDRDLDAAIQRNSKLTLRVGLA